MTPPNFSAGQETAMHVIQFNELPHIADVEPINEYERECLNAVRGVLESFGCLDRFGITLLHNHFKM
jgi:hypothetical protein